MKKGAERMKRAGKLLVIGLFSLLLSGCMVHDAGDVALPPAEARGRV